MVSRDGFLNVFKPAGMSSHAVVARMRKLTGIKRIGHAGTLDPDAVGVLPLAVGRYTRLLDYALLTPKIYRAYVSVGSMTHTGDASGRITGRSRAWSIGETQLEDSARWLIGRSWQIPPQVSALKVGGRRHYDAVRHQETVWPAPRRTVIQAITEIGVTDDGWRFEAEVGPGTYIRALVRDWAAFLGVAAHLKALERIRVGAFFDTASHTLAELEQDSENWCRWLTPWDQVVLVDQQRVLDTNEVKLVRHGDIRALGHLAGKPSGRLALHDEQGDLVAIVEGPPYHYCLVL